MTLNPEQFSHELETEGGFSVSPAGHKPRKGYMTSVYGHEKVVEGIADPETIATYAAAERPSGTYLGGWVDKGKTYLDASRRFMSRRNVVRFGERNAQIAGYDVERGTDIPFFTPPTRRGTLLAQLPRKDYVRYARSEAQVRQRRAAEKLSRRAR